MPSLWLSAGLVAIALALAATRDCEWTGRAIAQAEQNISSIERELRQTIQKLRNGELSVPQFNVKLTDAKRALRAQARSPPVAPPTSGYIHPRAGPATKNGDALKAYEERFERTIRGTHKRVPLNGERTDRSDHVDDVVARIDAILAAVNTPERERRLDDLMALLRN